MRIPAMILQNASVLGAALAVLSCAPILPVHPQAGLSLDGEGARWVKAMMERLTPEEKVAQMIGCRYAGEFYPADAEQTAYLKRLVARHKVGGMVIFGGQAYETALLNNALQSLADVPLLVASDLERGAGTQITGSTLFPAFMGLGAADSEDLAYEMGRYTALEGRALGIHMTYAPVVDVNINPDNPIINTRAFGENPERIARLASAFIKGCQDHGMIATAKHFPGHGDTDLDSHILLPVITADRERLEKVELYPYRRAIEAGVGAIMVSHLVVPALDPTPNLPATLSPAILTGLLRGQMGFQGLIVTDAMEMGGVTNSFPPTEAALKAIQAGCDMVLLPPETEKVVDFLKEQVRTGVLSGERVDASARRILEAKARLGLHRSRFVDVASLPLKLGRKEALAQALKTFEAAATLVKNDGDIVPLKPETKIAVFSLSSDRGEYFTGRTFANAVKARAPQTDIFYADADTGQEFLDDALAKAAGADVCLCALFSSLSASKGSVGLDAKHVALIKKLKETGKPVVAVSFGSPYFLGDFPGIDAYICLYRNQPQAQSTAAKAIFGEIDVTGKLPVTIPGAAAAGQGVMLKKK